MTTAINMWREYIKDILLKALMGYDAISFEPDELTGMPSTRQSTNGASTCQATHHVEVLERP